MWKKNEARTYTPQTPTPTPTPVNQPERSKKELSIIGPSITVKGELFGKEDLEVQGKVEGTISLKKHSVSVGENGRVKADIHAKSIQIGGDVKGNLFGEDEVVLLQSGRVEGDIKASRVTLENGSKFKGSIDMEPKSEDKERDKERTRDDDASKSTKSPENGSFATQGSSLRSGSSAPA
jgi:cytoskeletal protein CcmA (bactofilin family)